MPKNNHLKGIVSAAVAGAETLIYTYPTRFHDIEEAKCYIQSICEKKQFHYGDQTSLIPKEIEWVKDKVHFLVALKAFEQGEFYLDVPIEDWRALRDAIEADIQRVLRLVHFWPCFFFNAEDAKTYVRRVCELKHFTYTVFDGVEPKKYQFYVNYNTARHAYEAGVFDMRWPGQHWTVKPQPRIPMPAATSLTDAIEADIARLTHLISDWPPRFADLNGARDFVSRVCWESKFRYTGWPSVALHRFKLYVNFTTAKYAYKAGKFAVTEEPGSAVMGKKKMPAAAGEKETVDGEMSDGNSDSEGTLVEARGAKGKVSTAPYGTVPSRPLKARVEQSAKPANTASSTAAANAGAAVNNIAPVSNNETHEALIPSPRLGATPSQAEVAPAIEEDPFKDLLAELGRVFTLKAAFD